MKQLLITIATLVLVGCGGDENKVRKWPRTTILHGEAKVALSSKYRDGKLLVKVLLSPYKGKVEQACREPFSVPTITLQFLDSDQFRVFEHEIKVKSMTHIKENSSKTLHCYYDGSITMPKEKYKMITSHNVLWRGFK